MHGTSSRIVNIIFAPWKKQLEKKCLTSSKKIVKYRASSHCVNCVSCVARVFLPGDWGGVVECTMASVVTQEDAVTTPDTPPPPPDPPSDDPPEAGQNRPADPVLSGLTRGGCVVLSAWAAEATTYPLDLIKTRMQIQGQHCH